MNDLPQTILNNMLGEKQPRTGWHVDIVLENGTTIHDNTLYTSEKDAIEVAKIKVIKLKNKGKKIKDYEVGHIIINN